MQAIFDAPITPNESNELLGRDMCGRQTGQAVNNLASVALILFVRISYFVFYKTLEVTH